MAGIKSCFSAPVVEEAWHTHDAPPPLVASHKDRQRRNELTRQLSTATRAYVVPRDASFLVNVSCDRQQSAPPVVAAVVAQQQGGGRGGFSSSQSFRRLSSLPRPERVAGSSGGGGGSATPFAAASQQAGGLRSASTTSGGGGSTSGAPPALAWSESRRMLEGSIALEQALTQQQVEPDLLSERSRLRQRLDRLGLVVLEADGDGNCQFRSVSQQLFGTQEHHMFVRQRAVEHMRRHAEEFEAFLGEDMDFYIAGMQEHGTWGDELTLRAICDSFGVVVHIVTSEQHNWYLKYEPAKLSKSSKEVFLTYIAPIHYNSLRRQKSIGRALSIQMPSLGRRQAA